MSSAVGDAREHVAQEGEVGCGRDHALEGGGPVDYHHHLTRVVRDGHGPLCVVAVAVAVR